MKLLEVELYQEDPLTLLRAINNFMGREVIIEDAEAGKLRGKPISRIRQTYTFRYCPDKKTVVDRTLNYRNLRKMQVVEPTEEDYRRAREGYSEVTNATIRETLKWAKRVRT